MGSGCILEYNHSSLYLCQGCNKRSVEESGYILGYNQYHLYFGLEFNEGRSEGGVTVS